MKHICVVARICYQYNAHMKHICVIARIYALAYVRRDDRMHTHNCKAVKNTSLSEMAKSIDAYGDNI